MRISLATLAATLFLSPAFAAEPAAPPPTAAAGEVTGIKAVCRNGQTFVTWKDAAEGEADAALRYALYRSDKPITADNLAGLEPVQKGIFYNSARLFGYGFSGKARLDPAKPMVVLEDGGEPLPMWSGVTAVTVEKPGKSYYAVVATDAKGAAVTKVVPGKSATTEAVDETVAPREPIRTNGTRGGGPSAFGKKLPLFVSLHASNAMAGDKGYGAGGDNYLYFGTPRMGYRDGLQGVFQVRENKGKEGASLTLDSKDPVEKPSDSPITYVMETYWFGYLCVPQWADHKEPRAYPFTERRMLWIIDWTVKKYDVDPDRIYAGGGSMGAWGSSTFAFRHPEIFAAVYPNRPRTRQKGMPAFPGTPKLSGPALMDDGKTPYLERMDMVKFATDHHEDLPVYVWCCGRRDGFASWQEQIDLVKALTANHHGFAFAWNNGDHSSGSYPMGSVTKYFGAGKFALHQSYPAFGNSSINDNLGNGDPKDGDLGNVDKAKGPTETFGINLGFIWKDVVDEEGRWAVTLSNDLCKADMTVDVTPRRCQKFKLKPGDKLKWTNSAGGAGDATADQWGLVTVEKVAIKPGAETTLTITR